MESASWSLVWYFGNRGDIQPPPRCAHALTPVDSGRSLIATFGCGTLSPIDNFFGDVWAFHRPSLRWKQLPILSPMTEEIPRAHHGAVTLNGAAVKEECIVIFGGIGPKGVLGDTLCLRPQAAEPGSFKWETLDIKVGPSPRYGHAMAKASRSVAVVFGGKDNDGNYFDDLWVFYGGESRWEKIDGFSGDRPTPRAFHTCVSDPSRQKLFVIGGEGPDGPCDEHMYILHMRKRLWVRVKCNGLPPRMGHCCGVLPLGIVVFGGSDSVDTKDDSAVPQTLVITGSAASCRVRDARSVGVGGAAPGEGHVGCCRLFPASCQVGNDLLVVGGWKPALKASTNSIWNLGNKTDLSEDSTVSFTAKSKLVGNKGKHVTLQGKPMVKDFFGVKEVTLHRPFQKVMEMSEGMRPTTRADCDLFASRVIEDIMQANMPKGTKPGSRNVWSTTRNFEDIEEPNSSFTMSATEVKKLCQFALKVIRREENVLKMTAPLKVFGDLHGQFQDLMHFFETYGSPVEADTLRCDINGFSYLFLGDYVDRGAFGLDVFCFLLALKILHPQEVVLLRGNHESPELHDKYGFLQECERRCGKDAESVYRSLVDVMLWLPLAAVVEDKICCMHAGIGPGVDSVEDIKKIERGKPISMSDNLLRDLLWSDPTDSDVICGYFPNPNRGIDVCKYGPDMVESFLSNSKLELIIRAHQPVEDGYEYFARGHLITVFSAPDYCGLGNKGGYLEINRDLRVQSKLVDPVVQNKPKPGRSATPPRSRRKTLDSAPIREVDEDEMDV